VVDVCVRCGFKAVDIRQMDVHHKDGNHQNDDPANLETLCANCHRLVHAR
jgi:5-methylcytosine-specific restriction endonuclease McrA